LENKNETIIQLLTNCKNCCPSYREIRGDGNCFYRALGAGKSIDFAYKLGINNIQLEGMEGDNTPVILKKNP